MSTKTQLAALARKKSVAIGFTALVSVASGAAGGYLFAKKRLEPIYEARASEEIAQARAHYATALKLDEFSKSPEELVAEKYGEAVGPDGLAYDSTSPTPDPVIKTDAQGVDYVDYSGMSTQHHKIVTDAHDAAGNSVLDKPVPDGPAEPESVDIRIEENDPDHQAGTVRRNVFQSQPPARDDMDWDWAEVMAQRENDPYTPYVITYEEFLENGNQFVQHELSYYEGDDILAHDDNTIVPDPDAVVGNRNLVCFGLKSGGDPDVVYVRNEGQDAEYIIRKYKASYTAVVRGYDGPTENDEPELRHSERRFRQRDD